jgi:hypothetical protein
MFRNSFIALLAASLLATAALAPTVALASKAHPPVPAPHPTPTPPPPPVLTTGTNGGPSR